MEHMVAMYSGDFYCKECLPPKARLDEPEEISVIQLDDELDVPPHCVVCGTEHRYMNIQFKECLMCGEWCAPHGHPYLRQGYSIPPQREEGRFKEGPGFQNKWKPFRTICTECFQCVAHWPLKWGDERFYRASDKGELTIVAFTLGEALTLPGSLLIEWDPEE